MKASPLDSPYQAFWCEENIWHLAAAPLIGVGERYVLIITGTSGHVACWEQQLAPPGQVIAWDYHVVLAVRDAGWVIWDFDTRLGCPVPMQTWLSHTFSGRTRVATDYQPRFLMIPAHEYRAQFTTDRAHMRDPDGNWLQPPPDWPAPQVPNGVSLQAYLQNARAGLTYEQLETKIN